MNSQPRLSEALRPLRTFAAGLPRGARVWCLIASMAPLSPAFAAGCAWDSEAFAFAGDARQQARCLLRPVAMGGAVADAPAALPFPLLAMVETPVRISSLRLRRYLQRQGIGEDGVGGAIDAPLSATEGPQPRRARYFVIHDTSWILCRREDFPADADAADAQWNRADTWRDHPQGHLFITRDGAAYAPQGRSFATPWRAVKFEMNLGVASRGLFLHVENVQLRRPEVAADQPVSDAQGQCVNDRIAQSPGFSAPQLRRLALVYVAASLRAGRWMIPAYHAVLDSGIPGGHDDPQNFDLDAWVDEVCAIRAELGDRCIAAGQWPTRRGRPTRVR